MIASLIFKTRNLGNVKESTSEAVLLSENEESNSVLFPMVRDGGHQPREMVAFERKRGTNKGELAC